MADPSAGIVPLYDRIGSGIFRGGESVIICTKDLPGAFCLRVCGTDRGKASLVVERSARTGQDYGKCDLILRDIGGNA